MRKFISSILFIFCFISVFAQSQDLQTEILVLNQKVDSLENKVSYLQLSLDINKLSSDIVNDKYYMDLCNTQLQLYFYAKNFDVRFVDSYKSVYNTYLDREQTHKELYEQLKELYFTNRMFHSFAKLDIESLNIGFSTLENEMASYSVSLKHLKDIIEIYRVSCIEYRK